MPQNPPELWLPYPFHPGCSLSCYPSWVCLTQPDPVSLTRLGPVSPLGSTRRRLSSRVIFPRFWVTCNRAYWLTHSSSPHACITCLPPSNPVLACHRLLSSASDISRWFASVLLPNWCLSPPDEIFIDFSTQPVPAASVLSPSPYAICLGSSAYPFCFGYTIPTKSCTQANTIISLFLQPSLFRSPSAEFRYKQLSPPIMGCSK
jgi:hypothetical protein